MLKYQGFLSNFVKLKLQAKVSGQQSFRWTAGIAAENVSYFDKASLESAKPFEELPSLRMLPFIGTAWTFFPIIGRYKIEHFSKALIDKRKLFGNIYWDKFGPASFVISFNVEDLKTMYENEGPYPERTDFETVKVYREMRKNWYTTLGVSLLNGKEWLDIRRKTQKHLMKPKAVLAFLNPMQDVARDFIDLIIKERDDNKEIPDIIKELSRWSLESVALVGLDARMGCLQTNLHPDSDGMKMINCTRSFFECILKLEPMIGNIPFWKYFPTPAWKKLIQTQDTFTEISFKHINRSLEKLKNSDDEDRELTLLQSMMITEGLDASSAMVMVNDMMLAGIDTMAACIPIAQFLEAIHNYKLLIYETSHTVGYFLYHIAKNPDKQEILYEHIKNILPHKDDRITTSKFNEFRYLKACLKESQRLNPIGGVQNRVLDHDVVFSGYRIPAGINLFVVVEGISKDERYFSQPNEFLPERWLNKDEKFHPFAFLPFGFGTRSCIGRRIAELEILCVATEIIRNFKVEYHYEDIEIVTRMMNVPDKPLRLRLIER